MSKCACNQVSSIDTPDINTPEIAVIGLQLIQSATFVETNYIKNIIGRALAYTKAGMPVHFRGPAGVGKTALAMHLAAKIGRPVILLQGDEEFRTSDLVGGEHGFRFRQVVDRFVSRVYKHESSLDKQWVDNRLTIACKYGFTLIYDEFTRSRPEANNILLHVLSERTMVMPVGVDGIESPYLKVHPNFTVIFTSNPVEYAGVYKSQDALRDRMITLDLDAYDYATEVAITQKKSDLSKSDAEIIVNIVSELRKIDSCEFGCSIRSCIKIAKVLASEGITPIIKNKDIIQTCVDVLVSELNSSAAGKNKNIIKKNTEEIIKKCIQLNEHVLSAKSLEKMQGQESNG